MTLDQRSWNIGWEAGYESGADEGRRMVERLIAPKYEPDSPATDTPWTFDGMEEVRCFWCDGEPPDHAEDCAWVEARLFIAPDLDSVAANPSSVAEATDG